MSDRVTANDDLGNIRCFDYGPDRNGNSILHHVASHNLHAYGDDVLESAMTLLLADNTRQYIDTRNNLHQTPLMLSVHHENLGIARALLHASASTAFEDRLGKNALAYACEAGNQALVALLLGEGELEIEGERGHGYGGADAAAPAAVGSAAGGGDSMEMADLALALEIAARDYTSDSDSHSDGNGGSGGSSGDFGGDGEHVFGGSGWNGFDDDYGDDYNGGNAGPYLPMFLRADSQQDFDAFLEFGPGFGLPGYAHENAQPQPLPRPRTQPPRQPQPQPQPQAHTASRACATLEESGKCSTPGCTATHDLCDRHMEDFASCRDSTCGKAHPRYTAYVTLSDCAVCFASLEHGAYQLPCTHFFHRACLQACIAPDELEARCPMCRERTFTRAQLERGGAVVMPERYRGMGRW
jgi:hypothetical protein